MTYNLETVTGNYTKIPINKSSMSKIKAYAQMARDIELYGFLLAPKGSNDGIVRDILLARNQSVSEASGHLRGVAVGQSKAEIENLGYKALGFWHSHANFGVCHSPTDNENMDTLYQTLAANNQEKRTIEQENIRYIDQENGKLVYRIEGLEISIALEKSDEVSEKRYLGKEHLILSDSTELIAGITKDLRLFIRDLGVVIENSNLESIEVRRYPGRQIQTIGAAYSIVTNNRGDEYGEIALSKWCGVCQSDEVKMYKDVEMDIIDDGIPDLFTESQLAADINERVKSRRGFFDDANETGNPIKSSLKNLWPFHKDTTGSQE